MGNRATFVIVGASMAGGRAAEALRERGFDGRVILIAAEPHRPYERPPLSKAYLQGSYEEEKLFLRPAGFYADKDVELQLGIRATALDVSARELELSGGRRLPFTKLLIATGAEVRKLAVPGADLEGVHYLRTLDDAQRLGRELRQARRLVVIGAGFIGSEVAASARALGRNVTMLEAAPVPLARALGARMGEVCANLQRDHGVDLRLGCGVAELRGARRVEEVVTASGEAIPCDLVVAGVGVGPAIGWLAGSGVALDNGVLVDEHTQSNVAGVFAAGDVANFWHPLFGQRMRLEHYDNASNQGIAAAAAMLGDGAAYAPVPTFWSDQYELTMQYAGHSSSDLPVVVRGDPARYAFIAFYMAEDRVRAAFSIGRPRDHSAAKRLIAAQKPIDAQTLADEQVDLRALAR